MTLHCPFCDREYSTLSSLKVHAQAEHASLIESETCPICGKNAVNSLSLIQHYRHRASKILQGARDRETVQHALLYILLKKHHYKGAAKEIKKAFFSLNGFEWKINVKPKRTFEATLCSGCSSRLLRDWTGLIGPTRKREYNGGEAREREEERVCEVCGSRGPWLTYILPKYKNAGGGNHAR